MCSNGCGNFSNFSSLGQTWSKKSDLKPDLSYYPYSEYLGQTNCSSSPSDQEKCFSVENYNPKSCGSYRSVDNTYVQKKNNIGVFESNNQENYDEGMYRQAYMSCYKPNIPVKFAKENYSSCCPSMPYSNLSQTWIDQNSYST
jgi:hypothetical protein